MIRWSTRGREPTSWAIAVVLIHFLVLVLHAIAHSRLGIPLSDAQKLFVGVVVVALPLVAAFILWKGDRRSGSALLTTSMSCIFILFCRAPTTWAIRGCRAEQVIFLMRPQSSS
jgi:hypothetical protein